MTPQTEDLFARVENETPSASQSAKQPLSQKQAQDFGLITPKNSSSTKNFVLDTNVLLHDPSSLDHFGDNHVCIPVDVLTELDRFKNEHSERGANARKVHRRLVKAFEGCESVTHGTETLGGGTIRLVLYDQNLCEKSSAALRRFHRFFPDREKVDHRILACTLLAARYNETPVILVTKDINMHLKARSVGLLCEDYQNDKVDEKEVASGNELKRIPVDQNELQRFASSGQLEIDKDRQTLLHTNEYVLLEAGEKQTMPARLNSSGQFVRLVIPEVLRIPDGHNLKPLNLGQKCFIDALLNPDISIVTCFGQAGTGKTLVAMAAGLHEVFNRQYNGITVSRPIIAMGDQLGFLPGDLDEKMRPWLQPIYDALEFLTSPSVQQPAKRKQNKGEGQQIGKKYEAYLEQGLIEIEALCYIRGRSIPNRFFVLDEAQQLTPQEAKTIVTRMSKGSKLVMVGDPAQIDHPYVDSRSNGLVYTKQKLRGQEFAAHITLARGERSELAEAGANLM